MTQNKHSNPFMKMKLIFLMYVNMIYVGNAHESQNTWVYAASSNSAVDVRDHAGPTHLIIRIVASYEVWAGVTHPPAAGLFLKMSVFSVMMAVLHSRGGKHRWR